MPQPPSIRRLGPADYRTMPWRNSGGSTTELAIGPAEAQLAGPFDWRLSIATLAGSGPFSRLEGVERIIIQLEGPPMRLVHAGREAHDLTLLTPYRFQGEWETVGELQGPARDFNVMATRARLSAAASVHHLKAGSQTTERASARVLAVYCSSGALVARVRGASSPWPVAAGETLLVERGGDDDVTIAAETDAVAIVVALSAKA